MLSLHYVIKIFSERSELKLGKTLDFQVFVGIILVMLFFHLLH